MKKDDKKVIKDEAKDSGEVGSKSFGWENLKKRFNNEVSSFVDLVKSHPIWSAIIGIGGTGGVIEEGVRRRYFKNKKLDKPGMPPPQVQVVPPQTGEVWGVNKFGYNKQEDCIYRNPNGKIKVVLFGSNRTLKDIKGDKLISKLKEINENQDQYEGKINEGNLEIIKINNPVDSNWLKEQAADFLVLAYKKRRPDNFNKFDIDLKVSKMVVGNTTYENVDFCKKSEFSIK